MTVNYYDTPRDWYGDPLKPEDAGLTIGPIRRDDEGRYVWTVAYDDSQQNPVSWSYCTDRNGDGIWLGVDQSGKQMVGHAQWTIRDVSASTRRKRVVRATLHLDGGF
jgi:hypothetical protein